MRSAAPRPRSVPVDQVIRLSENAHHDARSRTMPRRRPEAAPRTRDHAICDRVAFSIVKPTSSSADATARASLTAFCKSDRAMHPSLPTISANRRSCVIAELPVVSTRRTAGPPTARRAFQRGAQPAASPRPPPASSSARALHTPTPTRSPADTDDRLYLLLQMLTPPRSPVPPLDHLRLVSFAAFDAPHVPMVSPRLGIPTRPEQNVSDCAGHHARASVVAQVVLDTAFVLHGISLVPKSHPVAYSRG